MIALDADGRYGFLAPQGEAIGRPGTVFVEVSRAGGAGVPIRIRIAGEATIVYQTELHL